MRITKHSIPNSMPFRYGNTHPSRVGMCAVVFGALCALLSCRDPRIEVSFHVATTPPIALQSARAVRRFFSNAYPHYRVSVHSHASQGEVIDALLRHDNSFAFIAPSSPPLPPMGVRSVFAVYYNFLHILVDASYLIQEETPRLDAPILLYEYQPRAAMERVVTQVFGASSVGVQVTADINDDAIARLQRGEIGAVAFFDTYPSMLLSDIVASHTRVRLLPLSPAITSSIVEDTSYLGVDRLPVEAYPYLINSEPIPALYIPTILVTDNTTDSRLVSELCESFMRNILEYRTLYPQFESLLPTGTRRDTRVPVHIGANDCL